MKLPEYSFRVMVKPPSLCRNPARVMKSEVGVDVESYSGTCVGAGAEVGGGVAVGAITPCVAISELAKYTP